MPVEYNSKPLIPAPFFNLSKEYIKSGDGTKVGSTFSISLEGRFIPHKGSPNANGEFYSGFNGSYPDDVLTNEEEVQLALFKKSAALRELFAREGQALVISTWKKGSAILDADGAETGEHNYDNFYCYPRVASISFGENTWNSPTTYTVTLEADEIFYSGSGATSVIDGFSREDYHVAIDERTTAQADFFTDWFSGYDISDEKWSDNRVYLSDANEDWAISRNDQNKNDLEEKTYTLTHSVSASGKRAFYEGSLIRESWRNAKMWVDARLGYKTIRGNSDKGYPQTDMGYQTPEELFETASDKEAVNKVFSDKGDLYGFDLSDYNFYNQTRDNNISKNSGSYSVTETWLLVKKDENNGLYKDTLDDLSVDVSVAPGGLTTVSLSGTITGLEQASSSDFESITEKKYTAALERWLVLNAPVNTPSLEYSVTNEDGTVTTTPENLGFDGSGYASYDTNKISIEDPDEDTLEVGDFVELKGTIDGNNIYGGIYSISKIDGTKAVINAPHNADFINVKWRKLNDASSANPSELCVLARKYSGVANLNPTVTTTTVAKNPAVGTISFTAVFDTRPSTFFEGAITESISVNDNHSVPVYAEVSIPGRSGGPVLQDMQTRTIATRQVNVEVTVPAIKLETQTGLSDPDFSEAASPASQADSLILHLYNDLKTTNKAGSGGIVFLVSDSENWAPWAGTYSRSVQWKWQKC